MSCTGSYLKKVMSKHSIKRGEAVGSRQPTNDLEKKEKQSQMLCMNVNLHLPFNFFHFGSFLGWSSFTFDEPCFFFDKTSIEIEVKIYQIKDFKFGLEPLPDMMEGLHR